MYMKQVMCRYGRMTILENDETIGRWLQEYGEWAQAEVDFLTRFLESGSVVLDIGAFIGTHTLAFAPAVGENGKVYSFEPRPEFFSLLKQNVTDNGLANVELFQAAVSDEAGYIDLAPIDLAKTLNFAGVALHYQEREANGRFEHVPITTIDQMALDKCDLIKIDAEGMEPKIVKGGKQTLERLRPRVYAEVLRLEEGWDIVLFMRTLGYRAFLHIPRMYNPMNFRGNPVDISSGARHPMLILLPEEDFKTAATRLPGGDELLPLPTADDMVLGLLKCPIYKNPFLANTEAAKHIGVDFFAIESELEYLKRTLGNLRREPESLAIQQIYNSVSWRITAPLRKAKLMLDALLAMLGRAIRRAVRGILQVPLHSRRLRSLGARLLAGHPVVGARLLRLAGLTLPDSYRSHSIKITPEGLTEPARAIYDDLRRLYRNRARNRQP